MWLLNTRTKELEYFEGRRVPQYAILSHRWEEEEATFQEWRTKGQSTEGNLKKGYIKILRCCEMVKGWELDYVWVDTCCINKDSSAELSEAINSMYNWYESAEVCLVYLSDVKTGSEIEEISKTPDNLVFYDTNWDRIGTKTNRSIARSITKVTGIPYQAIARFTPRRYSVATGMSWAAQRKTAQEEDRAYSLLGIFGINMPMLYDEGEAAFQRLQEEIINISDDRSIFLWEGPANELFVAFASVPDSFTNPLSRRIVEALPKSEVTGYIITNAGVSIQLWLKPIDSMVYIGYLGSVVVDETRYLCGIYVIQDDGNLQSNRFRRVRFRHNCCIMNIYDAIGLTELKIVEAIWVRQPLKGYTTEESLAFTIKALSFDHLLSTPETMNYHESDHTRHVIRRTGIKNSFLGSIYSLSLSKSLIVITVGIDISGRPMCVIDVWPPKLTKAALNSLDLDEDYTASNTSIDDSGLASKLRNAFDDLHVSGSNNVNPNDSFMITFRGTTNFSSFTYHSTAFEFHPIKDGYELVIKQVQEVSNSDNHFAVWPMEHRIYDQYHPIVSEDYHTNLLMQLRDASDIQKGD